MGDVIGADHALDGNAKASRPPHVLDVRRMRRNPVAPDSPTSIPDWLSGLIREFDAQPVANPPAFVGRYDYRGRSVYFVPQRCCDIMGVVYRLDGSVMCYPEGGFSGTGDGRCTDFFVERTNEEIVWRDAR